MSITEASIKGLLNYACGQPIDLLVNKRRRSLNKPRKQSLVSFYKRITLTFRSRVIYVIYLVIVNGVKMLLLKHKEPADFMIIILVPFWLF